MRPIKRGDSNLLTIPLCNGMKKLVKALKEKHKKGERGYELLLDEFEKRTYRENEGYKYVLSDNDVLKVGHDGE